MVSSSRPVYGKRRPVQRNENGDSSSSSPIVGRLQVNEAKEIKRKKEE